MKYYLSDQFKINYKTCLVFVIGYTLFLGYYSPLQAYSFTGGTNQSQESRNNDIDSDGDGIDDTLDQDDDNDGIPDRAEGICTNIPLTDITFIGQADESVMECELILSNNAIWKSSYSSNILSLPIHLEFSGDRFTNKMLGLIPLNAAETISGWNDDAYKIYLKIGEVYGKFPDQWNVGPMTYQSVDKFELIIGSDGMLQALQNGNVFYTRQVPITTYKLALSSLNGGEFYSVKLKENLGDCPIGDSDQDGIPNSLDLDSDNDGCPDATEGSMAFDINDLDDFGALTGNVENDPLSLNYGIPLIASNGQENISSYQSFDLPGDLTCICVTANEPLDFDGDGICDSADRCPNFDDALIGTSCDDGDVCTTNDIWTSNCQCSGIILSDIDQDGFCDAIDRCMGMDDDIDIDNDGIPYCEDNCIDLNENSICDEAESASITDKLKIYFSHKRGFYDETFQLTLIPNDPLATIKYILGTNPNCPDINSGILYTTPINITNNNSIQTLKVIAFTDQDTTKVYTHSYLFDGTNLPTVVHSCSPYQVAEGELETPISFEFIVPNGHELKSVQEYAGTASSCGGVNCGKFDKVYFRGAYGAGTLEAELFDDVYFGSKPIPQIDQLFLRDTTNKVSFTLVKQLIAHDFMKELGPISPSGRIVYRYEDGFFNGPSHMHERPEAGFMETYTDIDKSNWSAGSAELPALPPVSNWDDIKQILNVESLNFFLVNQWIANVVDYVPFRNWRMTWPTNFNDADGDKLRIHFFNWDLDGGYDYRSLNYPLFPFVSSADEWPMDSFIYPGSIQDSLQLQTYDEYNLVLADAIHCAIMDDGILQVENMMAVIRQRVDEISQFISGYDSFEDKMESWIPKQTYSLDI